MLRHASFREPITRDALVDCYRAGRARTRALFNMIAPEAYYERPIALRNPIVFYEGHLPGFSVNTLVKLAHGRNGVDAQLETLFARGIDPEDESAVRSPTELWPSRDRVQQFADACDALVIDALRNLPLEDDDVPPLRGGEAIFTVLEHELMHHETLSYMFHELAYEKKSGLEGPALSRPTRRRAESPSLQQIPAGMASLGTPRGHFGWDNEFPSHTVHVPTFTIDSHNVTNGDYLAYIEATHAAPPHFWLPQDGDWWWRGMFALESMNLHAPVYVTHAEAEAYARWIGKRLPTEAEWHRAAEGDEGQGHFDFKSFDPISVGQYPPSAHGVYDLTGNGWEWTSTIFDGYPGFTPMPSYPVYSSDFFDGAHYVMKGASPVTGRMLVRPGFRNWFRPHYPYVYATFRCVT
jgi:formylglycine-generating enzyme required for sulfatase activity